MSYICTFCNYSTGDAANFARHKKTKKHLRLDFEKSNTAKEKIAKISTNTLNKLNGCSPKLTPEKKLTENYICKICQNSFKHKSSLSRHKNSCNKNLENSEKDYRLQFEKEKSELLTELLKEKTEMLKEKSELLNNFMSNANTIINKAQDNTKVTAEAMKSVSMSAIKYANEKFQNTPALLPLQNFNINNLDFDNENNKEQLVEILIYNAKQKSLDKLLGDHIVKEYKKDNPEDQSFHTTDCSRLNYIVRELIENALIWSVDKNGLKICKDIVKPLIKKCINALLEHQKILLQSMGTGNYNKQKDVELIIDVIMSIDSGSLEADINKYIAPYFNLNKKEN